MSSGPRQVQKQRPASTASSRRRAEEAEAAEQAAAEHDDQKAKEGRDRREELLDRAAELVASIERLV
jgi:hypothetical protein